MDKHIAGDLDSSFTIVAWDPKAGSMMSTVHPTMAEAWTRSQTRSQIRTLKKVQITERDIRPIMVPLDDNDESIKLETSLHVKKRNNLLSMMPTKKTSLIST